MPPVNQAALSAGVIAVSVAVAAAIAVYESPELRRMADDLRRRIAIALHSIGDNIEPPSREPLFNRPEDAEGFLQSRGALGRDQGVDADDETKRRQREELMYWNSLLEANKDKEKEDVQATDEKDTETRPRLRSSTRGSSFDDFLKQDDAEKGAYVFNTGTKIHDDAGLVRRRVDGVRGLNHSLYANPFADENGIDFEEQQAMETSMMAPDQDESLPDIYGVSDDGKNEVTRSAENSPPTLLDLEDLDVPQAHSPVTEPVLPENEYMTAGQEDQNEAFASIQAWAQTTNPSFYSPLPVSPAAPLSEPELVSDGALTPTDSASLNGSGEDIGDDAFSTRSGERGRHYDVMSESEDGMTTPASWTEVGSVISESDAGQIHA